MSEGICSTCGSEIVVGGSSATGLIQELHSALSEAKEMLRESEVANERLRAAHARLVYAATEESRTWSEPLETRADWYKAPPAHPTHEQDIDAQDRVAFMGEVYE